MKRRVYLDNHATTPIDARVLAAMHPYLTEQFGNPGSIGHVFGEEARDAVDDARARLAKELHVAENEVVFTSGATESNNLALRGVMERHRGRGGHLISVATEHKAVLDPLQRLARQGFEVTLLSPEQSGSPRAGWLDPAKVAAALQSHTILVSVMMANNEIGVIQPIKEIAEVCHQQGVLVHCDATQAVGRLPVDVPQLDVDLLSFSGHKIYGPRGIGVLVVRRRRPRIKITPLIDGGGQEHGLRSGTLNVPAIVGLAEALELCTAEMSVESARIERLRQQLHDTLLERLDGVHLNGPEFGLRLPGNLNLCFEHVDGEALMLNMSHVAVSSGSACTSANPEPSHVLRAIGLSEDETRSSLRFGLGRLNDADDIRFAADTVVEVVQRLRRLGAGS